MTSKDFSRITRKYLNVKLKLNVSIVDEKPGIWRVVILLKDGKTTISINILNEIASFYQILSTKSPHISSCFVCLTFV